MSVLELYRLRGKQWFRFNFNYLILVNLFALLVMLIFYFISEGISILNSQFSFIGFIDFLQNSGFKKVTTGIVVIAMSFSAIHLFYCEFSEEKQQPSIYYCYQSIANRKWKLFFMSVILLVMFSFLLSKFHLQDNSAELIRHAAPDNEHQFFAFIYIQSTTNYLLNFLPFILSGIILISYFNDILTTVVIKKYANALATIMVFGFISNALISEVQIFVDTMIVGLLRIVFTDSIVVYLFSLAAYLLVAAFLMLIYSSAFLYPVWFEFQNIQQLEKAESQMKISLDEMSEM